MKTLSCTQFTDIQTITYMDGQWRLTTTYTTPLRWPVELKLSFLTSGKGFKVANFKCKNLKTIKLSFVHI